MSQRRKTRNSRQYTVGKPPPYSPDLNPSENMWDKIRVTFFCNIAFDLMTAVEGKLIEASSFYENNSKIVQSITAWEWFISASLIGNWHYSTDATEPIKAMVLAETAPSGKAYF